jgi:hypothetical protein
MVEVLPAPEVARCYFDDAFDPPLPAMCLRWGPPEDEGPDEQVWELPEGVRLHGPAPRRFGISVCRQAADSYAVRLLWDRTCLTWLALGREQLLASDLAPLLAVLGTDLWYLLDQPLAPEPPRWAA